MPVRAISLNNSLKSPVSLDAKSSGWFEPADVVACLALANLYLLNLWSELQDPLYAYYRHTPIRTWIMMVKALAWLVLLAGLFWPLVAGARRLRRPILRKSACVLLLVVLVPALDMARLYGLRMFSPTIPAKALAALAIAAAGVTLYLVFRDRLLFRLVRHLLIFLAFLMPFNIATTAGSIHHAWATERYHERSASWLAHPAPAPRFVWIVFDEWDHYLTFPGREAGLLLPEIDRFRGQSLHAESVNSPAPNTQESLPSLITGRVVARTERIAPDDLLLTYEGSGQGVPWSKQPNVFQRVRQMNINAGLAGFYHPYPRVIGADLPSSFSVSTMTLFEEPVFWEPVHGLAKLLHLLQAPLHRVPLLAKSGWLGDWQRRHGVEMAYRLLRPHAFELVEKPEIGLAFLHLPVPHPPAIYDRKLGIVTADNRNGYTDNLALLDRTLGELRQKMEAAGQWDGAFILLTSDHPLRGKKDKHSEIPFLLKVPGQTQELAYQKHFNSVLTQELVIGALKGELHSARDVSDWLDQARFRFPESTPHSSTNTSQPSSRQHR